MACDRCDELERRLDLMQARQDAMESALDSEIARAAKAENKLRTRQVLIEGHVDSLVKLSRRIVYLQGDGEPDWWPKQPGHLVLWMDTSIGGGHVLKYWDMGADEWVRMDGGGDIPNGMIVDRHINDEAGIQRSKLEPEDKS